MLHPTLSSFFFVMAHIYKYLGIYCVTKTTYISLANFRIDYDHDYDYT